MIDCQALGDRPVARDRLAGHPCFKGRVQGNIKPCLTDIKANKELQFEPSFIKIGQVNQKLYNFLYIPGGFANLPLKFLFIYLKAHCI